MHIYSGEQYISTPRPKRLAVHQVLPLAGGFLRLVSPRSPLSIRSELTMKAQRKAFALLAMLVSLSIAAESASMAHVHQHSHQTSKERVEDGGYLPRDHEHMRDGEHNSEFDHEAILGKGSFQVFQKNNHAMSCKMIHLSGELHFGTFRILRDPNMVLFLQFHSGFCY